jgi:hypothetical protein
MAVSREGGRVMSYCRFYNADIYLFNDVGGYINCMACSLAPKIITKFTTGDELLKLKPCDCHGKGCEKCMMHDDTHLANAKEALKHVKLHRKNGDYVPESVDEQLRSEVE